MRAPRTACLVSLSVLALAREGAPCGLTPPIGPNGLPAVCHGDPDAVRFRAGVSAGGTSTRIHFGNADAALVQGATVASLDVFLLERLGLGVSLGSALGGRVEYRRERFTLSPGPVGGVAVSYRLWGGDVPFVHASLALSLASVTTEAPDGSEARFTSRDWRAGLALGHLVTSWAAPFVVGRYFGAGTRWSPAGGGGSDAFRYHAGVGSAFALGREVDALAEVAFLGEKRATLGVGIGF